MLSFALHDYRKHFAAAVLITFLATVLSLLGIVEAGRRAIEAHGRSCTSDDLRLPICLELGRPLELCAREWSEKSRCILAGMKGQLGADNLFLISYSALNLSFFLFLAAIGRARPTALWVAVGIILAIVMAGADSLENREICRWIGLAADRIPAPPPAAPRLLEDATLVKWGAQAVASVLLGILYLAAPRRTGEPAVSPPDSQQAAKLSTLRAVRWLSPKLVALAALVATIYLAAGLYRRCPDWVQTGSMVLGAVWIAILIHAVLVVVEPQLPSIAQAANAGGPPHD